MRDAEYAEDVCHVRCRRFELVKALAKGCKLHVVLSPADVAGFEKLLTEDFDQIAGIIAALDAKDAQISKVTPLRWNASRLCGVLCLRRYAIECVCVARVCSD